ncbi:uncharacterized protein LOC135503616 isoform X2 [Lineus longissimus]
MVAAVRFSELITVCVTIFGLAQGVSYHVTMYIADTPNAATKSEVIVSLIGTKGESEKKSLGSVSTTTSTIITSPNLGFLKTLVTEKKQSGIFNDDNLQFLKVTVKSDEEAHTYAFLCPHPYCTIKWPNLMVKLHGGVDGQWSKWTSWRCECARNTNRRTRYRKCDNPAPYFTGAACVGSNVDTIISGCYAECRPFYTTKTPKPVITTSTSSSSSTSTTEKGPTTSSRQSRTNSCNVLIIGAVVVTYMLTWQS